MAAPSAESDPRPDVASVERLPPWQQAVRARCRHPSGWFEPLPVQALDGTLTERLADVVGRHPDRTAVRTLEAHLTYAELWEGALRIARALVRSAGPEPGRVGVLHEHGAAQITALLGVLLAGKTYVPLDPAYPLARLRFMVADAGVRTLLCAEPRRALAARLDDGAAVLGLDALADTPADGALPPPVRPGDEAIVLYTSGSTGEPKGFAQTHANILHDVQGYASAARFSPEDRYLLVSPMTFADSLRTLYGALMTGGALYPFDLRAHAIEKLAAWIDTSAITVYRSVPTVYRHFVRCLGPGTTFPQLRLVYLSGEPVYARDVEAYRARFPDECLLVNRLGTGEALTYCACFLDKETAVDGVHVPVGFAVAGKRAFLLDAARDDEGWVGEIAVQSRYLTPGYLGRPELTAAVFLPDPAGGDQRLYRTGDLGRIRPDGCLVHLGRKDFQVKIRGHRVETAEVEARLADLPQLRPRLREVAVTARREGDGDARLIAYLAPGGDDAPTASVLRRSLAASLPAFMIPARFVFLDALPRTHTGKLDRRALPVPPPERPALDAGHTPPRDALETYLAAVWSEVLAIPGIGVHDPFLELGGDSLQAARIIARILADLDLDLEAEVLFETSTIAELAGAIRG